MTEVEGMSGPPSAGSTGRSSERAADAAGPTRRDRVIAALVSIALVTAAIAVSVVSQWRWLALHDDVRGSVGALRVGEAGGRSPLDIFTHRPMANRIVMSGLDHLTAGPVGLRERLTLTAAMVGAGIAAACLAYSLRRWVGTVAGTLVGLATFAALAWAPDNTLLQPEWTAVLLCLPALALALARGAEHAPRWHSPLMAGAGLLFAVATLQKYTTATSALLAWLIVLVLSRRRAAIAAVWTVLLTAALFGLTMLQPHERQWFTELPRLQPRGEVPWREFATSIWRVFWVNPILLLWPAASGYGYAVSRRRVWLWGPLLAVVLTLAGVGFQQRFYPYHYGALPVLMAGLVALAAASWWRRTGRLPHAVIVVAAVWLPIAAGMGHQPYGWRVQHPGYAVAGVLVAAGLAGLLAAGQGWRARAATTSRRGWPLVLTAVALALVVSFPDWPRTPTAYNLINTTRVSQLTRRAEMVADGKQIRAAAGGAPVAYLTQQEGSYFVGLPATCSYPLPVFLYRSVGARAGDLTGFRQNLDCLRDPAARFVVLQESAAAPGRALPEVRSTLAQEFDCEHPVTRNATYALCPRR